MSPLQSILLFEIQSVRVKFQLEIECFTLEFHIETSTAETHVTIKIPHDLQQTHALWSSAKTTNPNLSVFCRSHKPRSHTIFSKPTTSDLQQKQQTQISLLFVFMGFWVPLSLFFVFVFWVSIWSLCFFVFVGFCFGFLFLCFFVFVDLCFLLVCLCTVFYDLWVLLQNPSLEDSIFIEFSYKSSMWYSICYNKLSKLYDTN